MSDITVESLKAKIDMVERDIKNLERDGNSLRKLEALNEYKSYLEDELRALQNDLRT
jgi:hypothetical protein